MSEAELHWLRSRLLGGKLEKARSGQLRFRPPTGLVYDPAGQVVFDPDEQVRQALRLVFDTFEQVGAALGVVQYFAENHLSVPTRLYGGIGAGHSPGAPWTMGEPWPSCIIRRTRAPTSTDGPRPVASSCPMRSPGSRDGRAASPSRIGRSSCTITIPATSPGTIPTESAPPDRELHIAAPGASRGDPRGRGAAPGPGPLRPVRAVHDHPLHGRRQDSLV